METSPRVLWMLLCSAFFAMPSLAIAEEPLSEFLDIHPELTADRSLPGTETWEKSGFDRARYDKVMLAPLTVFLDPDSEYKGFDSDDARALASGFRDRITATLGPEITVVDAPGNGVLYVRAALTHVKLTKPGRGPLSFTPIGMVVTAVQDAAGKRISLRDTAIELEAYDSVSGEPMAVLVARHPGPRDGARQLSWNDIEDSFNLFAARFKSRVLAARGSSR